MDTDTDREIFPNRVVENMERTIRKSRIKRMRRRRIRRRRMKQRKMRRKITRN